ncbi:GNAT family N-acetyltransferase [Arthrobacter castelli]|uniref:GNAT family N-acetyltransferase n=1 Tax=Arthrobacter castelli TaxID=271431 RepID=UPI0006888F36|nr:GNAT family N-acetyltransferase [Arthrobacter castelli]
MSGKIVLRELADTDIRAVSEINNSVVPAVPYTDERGIADLIQVSGLSLVAVPEDETSRVVGFVLGVPAGAAYDSENFRWFEQRGEPHFYVDRIVVAGGMRGRNVGVLLYDAVFEHALANGVEQVTCEVNIDPPNPGSLKFHGRLGFTEVGRQPTKEGTVTVAMMSRKHEPPRHGAGGD